MQINRNQKVLAGELKPGDRFYKFNDKNKLVFEKISDKWCISVLFCDAKRFDEKAREAAKKEIRSETEVIFLRSKTENF